MGRLILPQDRLTWHCQNVGLVGKGDGAPPKTATSLPAPTSLRHSGGENYGAGVNHGQPVT